MVGESWEKDRVSRRMEKKEESRKKRKRKKKMEVVAGHCTSCLLLVRSANVVSLIGRSEEGPIWFGEF